MFWTWVKYNLFDFIFKIVLLATIIIGGLLIINEVRDNRDKVLWNRESSILAIEKNLEKLSNKIFNVIDENHNNIKINRGISTENNKMLKELLEIEKSTKNLDK